MLHYKNVLCWVKKASGAQKKNSEDQATIRGKYVIAPLLGHWENPAQDRRSQSSVECKVALYVA